MTKILLLLIIAGIAGSIIAKKRGRNPLGWFILCALFPFLIIAIAVLPTRAAEGYTKKCPYCAEIIKEDANYCKYCGRELPIEMVMVSNKNCDKVYTINEKKNED